MLVTGGAGFVGSHLVESMLKQGYSVSVLDNLSSGKHKNLDGILDDQNLKLVVGDCRNPDDVEKALRGTHTVFHLAATPDVRLEIADPRACYQHNIKATFVLLEKIRKSKVETVVLTSSSTVYGDAKIMPTPEDYGPLKPISVYGASKLACEALVSSYCHSFKKRGIIIRPANITGPRATHGVLLDFMQKLKTNSSELEILGDGTQTKSYLHVSDFVGAVNKCYKSADALVDIYNVGTDDQTKVTEIAKIAMDAMNLRDVKFKFSGGTEGGRGWVGDVKKMLLSCKKIRSLGWKPTYGSTDAVSEAAHHMVREL